MKKIILALVICYIQIPAVAYCQMYEAMAVDFTTYTGSSIYSESGAIRFAIPIVRQGNNRLLLSPEYKFFNTKNIDDISANYYNRFGLRLAWQYKMNESWKLQWVAMPSFSSLFGHKNDILFNTIFRANYKVSDFTYTLGIAYSYRYMNNIFTPVAGVVWKPADKLTLSAKLPLNLKVLYNVKPSWDMGLELSGGGISSLSESESYDFLWIHERNLFLTSDFKLYKNWWFSCSAGYVLKRTLKTYELPENPVWTLKINIGEPGLTPINAYNETGFVARIGLKFKMGR